MLEFLFGNLPSVRSKVLTKSVIGRVGISPGGHRSLTSTVWSLPSLSLRVDTMIKMSMIFTKTRESPESDSLLRLRLTGVYIQVKIWILCSI